MKTRRFLSFGCAMLLLCGPTALFPIWHAEDHRTRYDKEGRYLPAMCLRMIAFAMHDYHEKHGCLPPAAIYSEDGRPLLSWRVLLLPFLEYEELYREFRLNEPWDSAHNIALLPKMPLLYCPLYGDPPFAPCTTPFQVFVGKGTPFESHARLRFKDFPRLPNTILIAEARNSVPWTKPEDSPYEECDPLPAFGGFFRGYFHVAMGDCLTVLVRDGFEAGKLRAAIVRNGDSKWPWAER